MANNKRDRIKFFNKLGVAVQLLGDALDIAENNGWDDSFDLHDQINRLTDLYNAASLIIDE